MDASAPDLFDQARTAFDRALQRNFKGLEYFASSGPTVGASPKDLLIQRGTMNLYHYRPMSDEVYRVPLLLVMATTNRGYIFDMVPGQSLVEYLLKAGYDVFMLDWTPPRRDEKSLTLADYVLDFIPTAIARVQEETGEEEFSLVGYCFGGVLSILWAALNPPISTKNPAPMKNLVCFTTPVDFSKMEMFQAWADKRFFDVDKLVDTFGNCPADYLYTAFDMLRPGARIAGNIRLLDNLWNDEFVKSFRMFDRWASDTLPLAGEYFRETTKKLMWDNRLHNDTMEVAGRPIDLSVITAPFLHVTAEHDHIVPSAASAPLIEKVGSTDKEQVTMKGGHVSLVAGGNAIKRLWPKLIDWLGERST
jgi:polyhydroxyalkanoate synthase